MDNRPLSEQWNEAAIHWAELEAAATILDETKSAVLSQMMSRYGDIPVSKAELKVKSSPEWYDHVIKICEARRAANLARVHKDFLQMKYRDQQNADANHRAEARL